MLHSIELEISIAQKIKILKKERFFLLKTDVVFIMLINVKMSQLLAIIINKQNK